MQPKWRASLNCDSQAAQGRAEQSRMTEGSPEARPKLEYMIKAINATLEQSFPPGNSIEKQGSCVLL